MFKTLSTNCQLTSWDAHGKGKTSTLVLRWDSSSEAAIDTHDQPLPVSFVNCSVHLWTVLLTLTQKFENGAWGWFFSVCFFFTHQHSPLTDPSQRNVTSIAKLLIILPPCTYTSVFDTMRFLSKSSLSQQPTQTLYLFKRAKHLSKQTRKTSSISNPCISDTPRKHHSKEYY